MPFATVAATTSGNTQLVGAFAGQRIIVLGYQISGKDSDTQVQLRSGTTTVLTRCYTPATGVGGISCPPSASNGEPYALCDLGEALNLNLSGTGAVVACVQYTTR